MRTSGIMIIVCLTKEYHKQLPSQFLDLGYVLYPGYTNNRSTSTKGIVTNIIYLFDHKEDKSTNDVAEDIKKAFNNIKGYYYSCNVHIGNKNSTRLGNIDGETDISRVLQMKALW